MIYTITVTIASVYLIWISYIMTTSGSNQMITKFIFKVIPGVAGFTLFFFLIAQFMGWPVQ